MSEPQQFSHVVCFTLVDRSAESAAKLVADCHEFLAEHSGLEFFAAGTISDNARDVNDREFDVSLHMVFASRADHDAYQVTPRHQQFIELNRSNWSRVRVFDSHLCGARQPS